MVRTGSLSTPVGQVAVTSDGEAIVRVAWRSGDPAPGDGPRDPLLVEALTQLRSYFDGTLTAFDLPVDLTRQPEATRLVLETLAASVEHGTSITYGELAARSGTGVPARAIGSIMGSNPIPLIIPCHRVVAADGLGGYSGGARGQGLATKRWLLEFEGALPAALF